MPDRLRFWFWGIEGGRYAWHEITLAAFKDSYRSLAYWVDVRKGIPPEVRGCRLAVTINDARPDDPEGPS